jgi:hypothetical protein
MRCIDGNIARMQRAVDHFGCDHRAIFATTYLVLTRTLRDTMLRDPHYFRDPRFMYTEDTVFANYYFNMLRDLEHGKPIPGAWAVAMGNAAHSDGNGAQDMLAGINAHVQRDMPYVVASLGLRRPGGASRKADHDRFNDVLDAAYQPVVDAIRQRYDPFVGISNASWDPADDVVGLEGVKGWREGVWRNAERLVSARTPQQRAQVEQSIEANATAWAHTIGDVPTPGYRAQRDAYCRAGGASGSGAAQPVLPRLPLGG